MRARRFWPTLKGRSIATRLFVSAIFWSVLILLVAGIVLSALYRRTAEADFDQRLGVYLRALLADVATPQTESASVPGQLGEPLFEIVLSGWYWQITRLDGTQHQIVSSSSLFADRLPKLPKPGGADSFGDTRQGYVTGPDQQRLRIIERNINTGDRGIFLVQVAATLEEFEDHIRDFEIWLATTFTALAAALIASSALQVNFGLRPLRALRHGVSAIRRGETDNIAGDFPRDIAPLASELNLLIEANRAIVERARTQVGNLAHALKTPLSVITNEASSEPGAFSDKVREQALLMRDQVTYYLDRARVAARAGAFGLSVEMRPVGEALVRTFVKLHPDKTVALICESAPAFAGEKQDLEEMIGNLVDNACKWANSQVQVEFASGMSEAGRGIVFVTVDDDGPGLPGDLRAAALRRGRRLDESKPGSGLGLSIVVDLAELYGGALVLATSPAGGLRARLQLPSA